MLTYTYYGMTSVLLSTLQTCLSDRLMSLFNFKPNDVAIYFFLFFVGALTCSLICAFLSRQCDKSVVILISLFICSFSLLLIGPSSILHFPPVREVVGIGLYFGGAYNSLSNYAVSQALVFTESDIHVHEYGDLVNSASALRPIFSGLGLFSGPIVGGLLMKYLGFSHMCEIYSLIFLVFAMIEFTIILRERRTATNQRSIIH